MEGKGGNAGGAVVDCSSPWTAAAHGLLPGSCFTGLAAEALPAAGVATLAVLYDPRGTAGSGCVVHPHWCCYNCHNIPRSATGTGDQRAFEEAEPAMKVIVS